MNAGNRVRDHHLSGTCLFQNVCCCVCTFISVKSSRQQVSDVSGPRRRREADKLQLITSHCHCTVVAFDGTSHCVHCHRFMSNDEASTTAVSSQVNRSYSLICIHDLYCVGGDVKPCSINQLINKQVVKTIISYSLMVLSKCSVTVWFHNALILISDENFVTQVWLECLIDK